MALLTLTPSREELQKFRALAHVSEVERKRIMGLPAGQTQRALNALQTEIATAKRKGKI